MKDPCQRRWRACSKRYVARWLPSAPNIFGFINAFKPPGPSSASFGSWVKAHAHASAVGHWGTLDPTACGVLVLALGKATKLLPLLHDDSKRYVFELVVGTKTNTGDASGTVIEKSPVPPGWQAALAQLAASFVGQLTQIPPMHSALKIDGQPLYRAARAGQEVARAPRTVTIGELRVIACEATTARLVVQCSAGTYVRTLCEQLGQRLEVPAHMGALLRVAAGPFTISQSVRPDQISRDVNSTLIDPLTVLRNERFEIDTAGATRFLHGNEVQVHADERTDRLTEGTDSRSEVLVTRDGALIGCGYLVRRDGRPPLIAPSRVLATQ